MTDSDTSQFLNNVNNTPKSFGHNKFQLEISQLNTKIDELEAISSQKDVKIKLFNQTLSNLGEQLRSKDSQISQLTNRLSLIENDNTSEITKLHNIVEHKVCCEKETNDKLECLSRDLITCNDTITLLKTQIQNMTNLLSEKSTEIDNLKTKLTTNSSLVTSLSDENEQLKSVLTTKSNIADNSGNEINGLKEHVLFYKSKVDELQSQLLQTKNEIELLTQPAVFIEETPLLGTVKKRNKDIKRRK